MTALEEEQKNEAHVATSHTGYSTNRGTPETTAKQDVGISQHDQCLPNQACQSWGEVTTVEPIQ
ncbi:MAG TPA: hypothetical protein VN648_13825 [Candidatus Methylomirabilis sp.]|nr:hypothetical protein [Candidatus Methylomirabilis sp.]